MRYRVYAKYYIEDVDTGGFSPPEINWLYGVYYSKEAADLAKKELQKQGFLSYILKGGF